MCRIAANFLHLIGAGLLIALCLAWPFTLNRPLFIAAYGRTGKPVVIGVGWSRLYLESSNVPLGTDMAWSISIRWPLASGAVAERTQLENPTVMHGRLGFNIGVTKGVLGDPTLHYQIAAAPLWAIVIPLLFVSQRWTRNRLQRRQRVKNGLCLQCGYDLRFTPSRCPECGLIPVRQPRFTSSK